MISRRCFLRESLAALGFTAIPGSGLFAAPAGWRHGGKPELVFGFITDSHIRRDGDPAKETVWPHTPDTYFRNALKFFRDAGVDAVLHGGDMADRGLRCELQFHANVWREIFPSDRLPNGQKVERLFVSGNHEWNRNNGFEFKVYPDPEVCERNVLHNDMPRHWRDVWGEPYEKAWHRVVKGYHFFGEHWEDDYGDVVPLLERAGKELQGSKPFFLVQHLMPGAYGKGLRTAKALESLPNGVVLFGHWHNSSANLGSFRHASCAMVNGPSLRGNGRSRMPGYEPDERTACPHNEIQQAILVRVYSDAVVFERHDFRNGGKVGPDVVLPLGDLSSKPFSSEMLAKAVGAPQFRKGSVLKLTDRGEHAELEIPVADANERSRVYAYEIVVSGEDGRRLHKSVYAAGADFAADSPLAKGPTLARLNPSEFPGGKKLTVAVRPLSSLASAGAPCGVSVPGLFAVGTTVLKAGTFNIRTADLEAKDPVQWRVRAPWVARAILAHDFDILGLQEVVARQLDDLGEALKRDYAHVGVCRDDGARQGEAAPIFYRKNRFELLDSGNFWLSERPDAPGVKGWDAACTRICTWAKFRDRATGKCFAFANTHLDHVGEIARRKGVELILSRLKTIRESGLACIVTGDFNSAEGDGAYAAATKDLRDSMAISRTPLIGPWRSTNGWRCCKEADDLAASEGVKVPLDVRRSRDFTRRIGGHRIDHIFVSEKVAVRAFRTYPDAEGRTYVSDHFPVSAILEF